MVQGSVADILALTLTSGLGPVLLSRAVETLGSTEAVLGASAADLQRVRGIGEGKSRSIVKELRSARGRAEDEIARAESLGVRLLVKGQAGYPSLLAQIPAAPTLLYVLGSVEALGDGQYPVGIVGSRRCTHYGLEQAQRFAGVFADSGLVVVSGGARGIDTAAHRGALRSGGVTVAVLGCGLAHRYPPENVALFDSIAESGGAIVSELPLETAAASENFPARNRIISGLSLGVMLIEAGRRSGALITARLAGDDHGREVFAVPGRVDSKASEGVLDLLKEGGAALVTEPGDVIAALESPARHRHGGTHADRYGQVGEPDELGMLSPEQDQIRRALEEPRTVDEIAEVAGMEPSRVRVVLTGLEISGRVGREGSRLVWRTQGACASGR